MSNKRRLFSRDGANRSYRKIIVVAIEGVETEREYFELLNSKDSVITITCLKDASNHNSPEHVLTRIKNYLDKKPLSKRDEAWIVVDKDGWKDSQLKELYNWSLEDKKYNFALSNPQFEYWLLLHFEDGLGLKSIKDCKVRLGKYISNYNKHLRGIIRKNMISNVKQAISRAKNRDNPPCKDWPRNFGCTTVYKLVEKVV